ALRIAPTYAAAHEYLGRLQLEAGRPEQGIAHLELAIELDVGLAMSMADMGRYKALTGDVAGFDEMIQRFREVTGRATELPVTMIELRVAAWRHDDARITEVRSRLPSQLPDTYALSAFAHDMRDGAAQMRERVARVLAAARNPRFASL